MVGVYGKSVQCRSLNSSSSTSLAAFSARMPAAVEINSITNILIRKSSFPENVGGVYIHKGT